MFNDSAALEWFEFAQTDLLSAQYLLDMQPTPYEVICYHCQQAAEKWLKGILVYHCAGDVNVPRTHNLIFLNKQCYEINAAFSDLTTVCDRLNIYGSIHRYPGNPQIEFSDMKQAVKDAEYIQKFLLDKGYKANAAREER